MKKLDVQFTRASGESLPVGTLAGEGKNPDRSHMDQLARQGDVSQREADHIFDEVQSAIANWPDHAAQAGVSPANIDRIAKSMPELK